MTNALGSFTIKNKATEEDMTGFAAETAIQANNSFHE